MAKVLIVDDSKLFSKALSKIVHKLFSDIEFASSGKEAIIKYKTLQPDLVLLDVTMPNMDGRECLEALLALNPNAIIVMVSGVQNDALIEDCLRKGAKAFVNKKSLALSEKGQNREFTDLLKNIMDVSEHVKAG